MRVRVCVCACVCEGHEGEEGDLPMCVRTRVMCICFAIHMQKINSRVRAHKPGECEASCHERVRGVAVYLGQEYGWGWIRIGHDEQRAAYR